MESKKSIVAIDDITDNLISYKALIKECFPNTDFYVATTGVVGLNLIRTYKPNVILLDIFMPEMDGFEVCAAIKNDEEVKSIPVIMITAGRGDTEIKIKALDAGADAFLTKPIDKSEFIAQIRAMIKIDENNQQKKSENERLIYLVDQRTSQLRQNHKKTLDLYNKLKIENKSRIKSESELLEAQKIAKITSFEMDLNTNIINWSQEALDLFKLEKVSDINTIDKIKNLFFLNEEDLFNELDEKYRQGEKLIQFEKIHTDNTNIDRYFNVRIMMVGNSTDKITYIRGTVQDISQQVEAEQKLLYMSEHDYLTDLYNRRYFENMLKRFDSKKYLPLSIIMADVNGLKIVNDSFGHFKGDELLIRTAQILRENTNSQAVISRLGGDEFVVLLPNSDKIYVESWIRNIKDKNVHDDKSIIGLSVSYGYAVKEKPDQDIKTILKLAEDNMYRNKITESSSMRYKSVDLIMNALFAKSPREMNHSKRVSDLCESIGKAVFTNQNDINQIRIAGLLHDIGKIGIDENILNKNGKLTFEEFNEIKKHSEIGFRILSSVSEFSELAKYILQHHEKYDGTGYPHGLAGKNISLQGRIMAVADAYDAMTSDRSYRKGMSHSQAVAELKRCSSTQFDEEIVNIFINIR